MTYDPWHRPRHAVSGNFIRTSPAEMGDAIGLPSMWKMHVEHLLTADDGKPHPTLTPWEIETLAFWWEYRPDHFLTKRQAALLRRIVDGARAYDAALARLAQEAERRG
jgi:hypothetical protein